MSAPDFEINTSIRAKRLVARVPPDAQTRAEGEGVTLARHEQRSGVPTTMEAGERYSDIAIDKRIIGETQRGHSIGSATGQNGPAAQEASDAGGQRHQQGRRRSSSTQRKRGTQVGSRKGPKASADSPSSIGNEATRSSRRSRPSAGQAAGTSKRKSSSPRSQKRSATTASSSPGGGLAEAVRNIQEGAAILREVRDNRPRLPDT
jgi:hypothetical protein